MQMLCRLFFAGWLFWTAGSCLAEDGREQLLAQTRQWVGAQLGKPAAAVQLVALDERVQVRSCDQALAFDWPFASRETVRASCQAKPGWQLFLRLDNATSAKAVRADAVQEQPKRQVVVARTALSRGTVLQPEMLMLAEVRQDPSLQTAFERIESVSLSALTRDIAAGVPLQAMDVRRAVLVQQGRMAVLKVGSAQGFEISVRVEVLQDGYMGDQVRLRNPESGKQLSGIVTGVNSLKGI